MLPSLTDITSPSDWPESLPEMRNIDNLLRCSICKEFFDVAVLIQECSHNYCSLCIRQSISHKTQCPTCSVKVSGNDLKCNRVLDELVSNFVKVRSKLLGLLQSNKISIQEDNNNEASDDSASMFMTTPRGKNVKQRKKSGKGKSPRVNITPRNKRKRQKMIESDSDDADSYPPVNVSIKQESVTPTVKSEPTKGPDTSNSSTMENQAGGASFFVECPVCGDMISGTTINQHLDTCLTREEKKSSLRSKTPSTSDAKPEQPSEAPATSIPSLVSPPTTSPSSSSSSPPRKKTSVSGSNAFISNKPKRKPITKVVYALLSDKQLREKLKEWNLSTQGSKQTMIKRHQEFVTIYNAQCDSNNPKPASMIVKEIEIRERTKKFAGSSTDPVLHSLNKDSSLDEVDKAHKKYSDQHADQFQQLINNVRTRKKKSVQSSIKDKEASISHVNIHEHDSEDIQEIPIDKAIKKGPNSSNSQENESSILVDDSVSMDASSSDCKIAVDQQGCSSSIKDQSLSENITCNQDVLMEENKQTENISSKNSVCSTSSNETGKDLSVDQAGQPKVPEPPSPSSLVMLNESENESEDEKDDNGDLGSSPSLGLESYDEEKELDNASESDSELFKTEIKRSPIRAKSLRTRKR